MSTDIKSADAIWTGNAQLFILMQMIHLAEMYDNQ